MRSAPVTVRFWATASRIAARDAKRSTATEGSIAPIASATETPVNWAIASFHRRTRPSSPVTAIPAGLASKTARIVSAASFTARSLARCADTSTTTAVANQPSEVSNQDRPTSTGMTVPSARTAETWRGATDTC